MFMFKPSKLVIDCFTANSSAMEYFPIDHAINFIPDWWKNAPKEYMVRELFPTSTMKRCPAIIETFKHGIMLPLWSDLAVAMRGSDNWEVKFASPLTRMEPHDSKQWDFYADPKDFTHIKLMSPWAISTKSDVKWTFTKPMWNFDADDDIFIAPGVLDFKTQHSTNINLLLPLKAARSYILEAGQPMAHLVPMSDKEIVIRRHLISESEYLARFVNKFSHSFVKGYLRANNMKKQSKCPFAFLKDKL